MLGKKYECKSRSKEAKDCQRFGWVAYIFFLAGCPSYCLSRKARISRNIRYLTNHHVHPSELLMGQNLAPQCAGTSRQAGPCELRDASRLW